VHGGADGGARPAPLLLQLGHGGAARQAKAPRVGGVLGAGHDLQPAAQLLERQHADGLLAEGAIVARLGRLEQVAGHLAQAIGRHAPAEVVDGDHRALTLAAQHHPHSLACAAGLHVLVSGVGHELVQRVFRVLVA